MDSIAANPVSGATQHDWVGALALTEPVAGGGYRWWYVDGVSDDGAQALTVIVFLGSVFSPYYALARRDRHVDPRNHVAFNVGLYGAAGHRWAMTERGSARLQTSASQIRIGPSALRCHDGALTITLDEITAPVPSRIRGTITVTPSALHTRRFALDAAERHFWQPVAPVARIEVQLDSPRRAWQGHGYVDSNGGSEPIEAAFESWNWSRTRLADGSGAMFYDICRRDGSAHLLSLRADPAGELAPIDPPQRAALARSRWGIARATRSEPDSPAVVQATLEDGPFYARSLVSSALGGQRVVSVHESVSLARFRAPWVRALLPFKMPRRS